MSIKISEIFGPTIQGEGTLIGQPTVFVRTGGCDYRCTWCDTLHAVDSGYRDTWKSMSPNQIMDKIRELSDGKPILVSLSGGNPAIQPLGELIDLGRKESYSFAMETQGSIAKEWFSKLDHLILSPKPPSSAMKTDWDALEGCIKAAGDKNKITLKIVIKDEEDYTYARQAGEKYPDLPLYLQPCNMSPAGMDQNGVDMDDIHRRTDWLIEKITNDGWFNVKVLPQLHVMLWGNKRGV
ncbi:MAG: 7-carboxy-7-deazaguanine synthase QueE [Alphaproteobacteria bacterium]|nr:7-carboxy-7-deazaguanine synthase QueE [Alphaproteobacteria bacterium]